MVGSTLCSTAPAQQHSSSAHSRVVVPTAAHSRVVAPKAEDAESLKASTHVRPVCWITTQLWDASAHERNRDTDSKNVTSEDLSELNQCKFIPLSVKKNFIH